MKIFIDGRFQENKNLHIENGRIHSITSGGVEMDFPKDSYLIPGMIDLHIHGANGADVMDATPEALQTISKTLAEEGVTGFLATTMTESISKIEAALENIAECKNIPGAEILGVHLEGPFLSADFILDPNPVLLTKWQALSGKLIKLMTLAPELKGALPFIKTAQDLGIVVSIGHTSASFAQAIAGIDAGARSATHLYNAMSGMHHRTPGAAAAILFDDRIYAELIADGHHVSPPMLKLAIKCKGLDKLILVTDAMRAKCLKNGEYDLGGQAVMVENGSARLKKDGVLAGSVLRLNGALRNFVESTGEALESCIPLVTSNPAKLLGLEGEIGRLAPSLKANLVVLNSNLEGLCTIREGRVIYKRNS